MTNEETLDLPTFLLSEIFAFVPSPDTTLETDSTLKFMNIRVNLHQDHVLDLHLHLEGFLIFYNQVPLKSMATTFKTFESRKKLKLTCIPLK